MSCLNEPFQSLNKNESIMNSKSPINTEQKASKGSKREPEHSGSDPYYSKENRNQFPNEIYSSNQNENNLNNVEFLDNKSNENYNELPPASPAISNLENMIKSTLSKYFSNLL